MKRSFWLMLIAVLALGMVLVACGPGDVDDDMDDDDAGEVVDDAGEDMAEDTDEPATKT